MPDIRIIDEYMPSKEPQSMRGYVINGHMPYARPEDTVICILGGPVFHLNEQFLACAEALSDTHGSVACATSMLKKTKLSARLPSL